MTKEDLFRSMSAIDEDILLRSEGVIKERAAVEAVSESGETVNGRSRIRKMTTWGGWVAMAAVLCAGILLGFILKTVLIGRSNHEKKPSVTPTATPELTGTPTPTPTEEPTPTPEKKPTQKPDPKSGSCGANGAEVQWQMDENGVLTISGKGAMKDYESELLGDVLPGTAGRL